MTDSEILTAIETVLNERMAHAHMDGFGPDARLNEDLYLDSVLILEIFLNLELEYGLSVPEEAIARQAIETVADLVALYQPKTFAVIVPAFPLTGGTSDEGVHGEAYYDIKVHCFVSCVCDGLKRRGLDHRPFYFGVWDAKFAVSVRFELLYHAPEISQEFFRAWFERLYGVTVVEWYDPDRAKLDNLAVLLDLVKNRSETGSVMVMLDMFHLPERENKFNQNPFPHYLMLQETADPKTWFVHDPDYRWEGEIARDKVIHAIMQPTVGGGYAFDNAQARTPEAEDLKAYFEACFVGDRNPLVDSARAIVAAHLEEANGVGLPELAAALRELPVITIRKYAYEHGFAFFWRALKLPAAEFEMWCEEIEALVQALKTLHYACMKLSQTGDRALAPAVFERLEEADRLELKLKKKLAEVFDLWCDLAIPAEVAMLKRPILKRVAR
jgi:acyl carrier protein